MKNLGNIPYTLRAYAKGLEQILRPIIEKMEFIENKIKNSGNLSLIIFFFEKCMKNSIT